jgi:cyclic beta-1,2-glucan synthetase
MDSAEAHLVRSKDGVILLLTPPFDSSSPHPGYIEGYPPGIRENGGQYTHAALWLAQARARMGSGSAAVALLQIINPIERTQDSTGVGMYRGEPYVVAADVSSSLLRTGVSGWTWYTGSAGWMYRIWIEDVFGFHLRGNQLLIRPEIPVDWPSCEMSFWYHTSLYRIEMVRLSGSNTCRVECDGHPVEQGIVNLVDDGVKHSIRVEIGATDGPADTRNQPDPKVRSVSSDRL